MASPYGFSQTGIELLYAQLAQRGISPAAASGAIAGVMGESGANLDPTSFNAKDPGGGSGGIGQWNRDRLVGNNGMLAFAQNAGVPGLNINTPTDAKKVPIAIQAQYLGHELDTRYAGVASQLRQAQTPQQALNVWVNSYENPLDKSGAIAQRSQYLAPVSARLAAAGGEAPGPIDPSIIARGGVSPAIPAGGTVSGTTLNSTPAAGGPIQQTAAAMKPLMKSMGLDDDGQPQDQQVKPSPMIQGPGARNVSPLLNNPQLYLQRMQNLASVGTPTPQWGSNAPGQNPWANAGMQAQPTTYGTTLGSQLGMLMDPMWMNSMGGGGYG